MMLRATPRSALHSERRLSTVGPLQKERDRAVTRVADVAADTADEDRVLAGGVLPHGRSRRAIAASQMELSGDDRSQIFS